MNRLISIFIVFSLVMFGSCEREYSQDPNRPEGKFAINVLAQFPQTRTSISEKGNHSSFRFNVQDSIGFFQDDYLTNIKLVCENSAQGVFKGSDLYSAYLLSNEEHSFYAYYPYSPSAGNNPSALNGVLPALQSAPFDCKADWLIAAPINTRYDIYNTVGLTFTFSRHLFSIVKLTIVNTSPAYEDERIIDVTLNSLAAPLAGSFVFNVTDIDSMADFSIDPSPSSIVKVQYPFSACPKLGIGQKHTVYAIVNATSFAPGDLNLNISTTNHVFSLPTSSAVSLSREQVTVFPTVDVSEGKVTEISDSKSLLSFDITDGVNTFSAFDISNGIVSIHVPNGYDLKNMTAVFSHNGAYASVNGVNQTSGISVQDYSDFENPILFEIYSSNGNKQQYSIRVFDLPIVTITTPTPITSNEEWTDNCSIVITEPGGIVNNLGSTIQVRGRGNTTWWPQKKPYTFKLEKKKEVLGMPADKRWNLLANYYDRTLIRNDIALEIAHRASGLPWASHGRFVEVIMNGEYLGNYYLCEHNKISKDRVNITEMSTDDKFEPAITGGYLLEYDNKVEDDPYFLSNIISVSTPSGPSGSRIKIKSPDDDGFDIQWAWIENYIHELESILIDEDAVLAHRYLDYMDIDSYIDWWFVHEICGNLEPIQSTGPLSCFMYKDRGGKMHAGPVWDFDRSFYSSLRGFALKNSLYYKYLFQDPLFIDRVKERWSILVADLEGMSDYIDKQIASISRSAARNGMMWPLYDEPNTNYYDKYLSVADASALLKTVYEDRIVELTSLIDALVATPSNSGTGNEDYDGQDDQTSDFGFGF